MIRKLLPVPCSIMIGIVPLIVRIKVQTYFPTDGMVSAIWPVDWDIFEWWKSLTIILTGVFALVILLGPLRSRLKELPTPILALVGLYSGLLTLSAAFSEYPGLAAWGAPNSYSGIWVHLSLLVVFLFSILAFKSESSWSPFFWAAGCGLALISVLGFVEFFGVSPFLTSLLKHVIFSSTELADRFYSNLSGFHGFRRGVSSTLANSNALGAYCSILIPFFIGYARAKKPSRYWAILFSSLALVLLFLSKSRTGLIAVFIGILPFLMQARQRGKLEVIFILSGFLYSYASFSEGNRLLDFRTLGDKLLIKTSLYELFVSSKDRKLFFNDEAGNEIPHQIIIAKNPDEKNQIRFLSKQLNDIYVVAAPSEQDGPVLKLMFNERTLSSFVVTQNGPKVLAWHRAWDSEVPQLFSWTLPEDIFSGRGFMWNRTFPLLRRSLLAGYGPDAFPNYFPQRDFYGKFKMGFPGEIAVDKPHSWYLSTFFSSGLVSLICLLGILFLFFRIRSDSAIFLGIKGSILAACILGLTYDFTNAISAIFWTLLGAGFSFSDPKAQTGSAKK